MRESGILMHITSLPGDYGVGTLGKEARDFVDFLSKAGQRCWQLLPVGPTGFGNSPYQSCSAFAGNPYLVDPETLTQEGLALANKIYERHTVLTQFLVRLGVDPEVAAEDACKVEHVLSEETFNALKNHLERYGK